MTMLSRRAFTGLTGAASAAALIGLPSLARAAGAKVVVVGAGFGGSVAAKWIKRLDPSIEVTLVEANPTFTTCPFSNMVLGGWRTLDSITYGYDGIAAKGVNVVVQRAEAIDIDARQLRLADGSALDYDRLLLSPGIDIRWNAIEGYDEAAAELMPHAWRAGAQTALLRSQLEAMEDGGTVIIAPPDNPFRCPPGPYERASLIANYLQKNKPRSKVLILDAKDNFAKQGLFTAGWAEFYGDLVEWVPVSQAGAISAVDPAGKRVITDFEEFEGDVVNIIPPQSAGRIALDAGLGGEGLWCEVDPASFESRVAAGIHVIGDASIAGAMPKSGFSANGQAKVAARAIVALLREEAPPAPSWINTCYSAVTDDNAVSVSAVYRLVDGQIVAVEGAGGLTPADAPAEDRALEWRYAVGWYDAITDEMFG